MPKGIQSAVLAFVLVVATAYLYFFWGPWTTGSYNSDAAVPLFMANGETFSRFHLYFLSQDSFGSWPFLVMQFVHVLTDFRWMPESYFLTQSLWLAAACGVLCLLYRSFPWILVTGFFLALVGNPGVSRYYFDLAMPFTWQLLPFVLGWLGIRRWCESLSESGGSFATFLGALVPCFLATWISVTSWPLLLVVAIIETMRTSKGVNDKRWSIRALSAVPAVLSGGLERILHEIHRTSSFAVYATHASAGHAPGLDFRGLRILVTSYAAESPWWPFFLIAAIASFGILSNRRGRIWRQPLADSDAFVLSAFSIALANIFLVFFFGRYENSQLAPTHLFATLGGFLALPGLIAKANRDLSQRQTELRAFSLASGITLLVVLFSAPPAPNPSYNEMKLFAKRLEREAPRALLLGDYREVYRYVALQGRDALVPILLPGQRERLPWNIPRLKEADRIVVARRYLPQFGLENPAPEIFEWGLHLKRLSSPWAHELPGFSVYENVTKRESVPAATGNT